MPKKKVTEFEIINHGKHHSQYFQGCGVSFTEWQDCTTGASSDAKLAYDDAVELLSSIYDVSILPKRPRGINAKLRTSTRDNEEVYVYVSIRFKFKEIK